MSDCPGEMRLLVVDDEHLERQAIKMILEKSSTTFMMVGEARNGREAVSQALELKPDIILLDIKMPGNGGMSAAREIIKQLPDCAIIFITAYDEFDYAQEALRLGAVDYLLKPVRTEELMEVLEKACEKILEEREKQEGWKRLQDQLDEALPWIRVNLGLGLVFGLWEERTAVEQQARLVNLGVLPQVAFGVRLDSRPQNDMTGAARMELVRFQLQRLIEDALDRYPAGLCLPLSERMLISLWGSQDPDRDRQLQRLAEYIVKAASEKLSLGVTVGLGRFCDDISQLPRSVWEAQTAAHLGMFYLGSERIVHVNELEQESVGGSSNLAREKEIITALKGGDREKVRGLFRELLGASSSGWISDLSLIKARLLSILSVYLRGVGLNRQEDMAGEAVSAYNYYTRRLSLSRSVEDLEQWLVDLAAARESLPGGRNRCSVDSALERVLSYIQDNYQKELSLTNLSKVIFLSPDYFSRIFKEQVGCTFSEYILRMRMEKAKELLSETDMLISDLARQVGYSDPNYFSRIFGRTVGVSPSRYRQKFNRHGGR